MRRDLHPTRPDRAPLHVRDDTIRTYVRSPRGRGRVLRVGRAAGRPAAPRPPGHRRRRRRAGGELRGEGVRHPHGDGRPAGAPPLPRRDRRPAALLGVHRGEPRDVRRLRGHARPSSKGCRSTRPSSTCAGWSGSRARPRRSRCGCAPQCASASGCPSPSASRGRSSSPRWRAGSRSRTACSSCPPTASSRSSTRCRSSACGASARRPRGGCRRGTCGRSASSPLSRSRRSSRCSVERPAAS